MRVFWHFFLNSFHLHVFLNLDKACAQFADRMLVFLNQLDGFCDGHKDFLQLYRHLSTFSTVDHVKNAQSFVNRVNTHCGTYGGTYENRISFSTCLQDPKSLILIWDTGDVKCEIPVRDVTKVNTVVGIGTTLHKFTDNNGNPVYLPCVLYHLPETDVRLFSPQTYHQMHGGYSEVHSDCIRMLLKTQQSKYESWGRNITFPLFSIPSFLEKQRKLWLPICVLAYATPA